MSKLLELEKLGQSVWFDFIRRSLVISGELQSLIEKGVRGVTSNPAIFEKAIAGSNDYDEDIIRLIKADKSVDDIYEALAFEDISGAADLLKNVYEISDGKDGYVSLEVNPNTVMRAYAYLQDKEIIYNKRGIGYFVANDAYQKTVELMKSNFIKNDLPDVFKTMRLLNMDFDELQTLSKKHLEQKP